MALPGFPLQCTLLHERALEAITRLISQAEDAGATVHDIGVAAGGNRRDRATRTIAPLVVTGMWAAIEIARTEIFGPVLVVYPYRALSEAITHIHRGGEPLTLYWYGRRNDRFAALTCQTRSGSVNANNFDWNMAGGLPFGGVGRSGMGNYHGRYGFDTFSHQRSVAFSALPVSAAGMLSPPFRPIDRWVADGQLWRWRRLLRSAGLRNPG